MNSLLVEEITDGFVKHQGDRVLAIIEKSADHNESDQPTGPGRPGAREKALKKELSAILDAAAEKARIPPSLLATRRDISAMIHGERELTVLQGWRYETVGQKLVEYLNKNAG